MSEQTPASGSRSEDTSSGVAGTPPSPTSPLAQPAATAPHASTSAPRPDVTVDVQVAPPEGPSREKVIGSGISWLATWSGRWILIAIALVFLGEVIGTTWSILMPLALALLIAAVLTPVVYTLERRLRFPPALAAATVLLGGVGLMVWGVFLMAPSVSSGSTQIADDAVKGISQLQDWVQDSNLVQKEQLDEFLAAAQDKLSESASTIASGVMTGVGAVTSVLINLVVIAFLVFFFLKDGRKFLPWLKRSTGPSVGAHLVEVSGRAWTTLGGFIRTQALVSGIDAVLIGIGLAVIGVPLAVPLAVLTFFGGFIPIVGAIAAGIVAVLVALVSNGLMGAVWVLVLILAVQQIEGNLLSPILQSKSMDLHPAIVLLSVTLGSSLYGIAGAFLAVPVAAVAAVIFRYLNEQTNQAVVEQGLAAATAPPEPPAAALPGSGIAVTFKERFGAAWAAARRKTHDDS